MSSIIPPGGGSVTVEPGGGIIIEPDGSLALAPGTAEGQILYTQGVGFTLQLSTPATTADANADVLLTADAAGHKAFVIQARADQTGGFATTAQFQIQRSNGTAALSIDLSGILYFAGVSGTTDTTVARTAPNELTETGLAAADTRFIVNGAVATQRLLAFQTAAVDRFELGLTLTAESGANAGSNFQIKAFTDAGALIDTPLAIARVAGGGITLARPVTITNTTDSSTTATGCLILAGGLGVAKSAFLAGPFDIAAGKFHVDVNGNLTAINGVVYSWPGLQGGVSTVLTNNGSGGLSWGTGGGGGSLNGADPPLRVNGTNVDLGFATSPTTSNVVNSVQWAAADNAHTALMLQEDVGQSVPLFRLQYSTGSDYLTIQQATVDIITDLTHLPTINLYNTTDITTNYEVGFAKWASNVFTIGTAQGGTGNSRSMTLEVVSAANTSSLTVMGGSIANNFLFANSAATSTTTFVGGQATFNASSGFQIMYAMLPTITQTGTAAYYGYYLNVTETTTGSGSKFLLYLANASVPEFTVDSSGNAVVANRLTVGAGSPYLARINSTADNAAGYFSATSNNSLSLLNTDATATGIAANITTTCNGIILNLGTGLAGSASYGLQIITTGTPLNAGNHDIFITSTGGAYASDVLNMNMAVGGGTFTGKFFNLLVNNVSKFSVDSNGGTLLTRVLSNNASTPVTVNAVDSNKLFTNAGGTTTQIVFNLPAAVAGLTYTFVATNSDTGGVQLAANGTNTVQIGAARSSAGGTVTSETLGASIKIMAISASEWYAEAAVGVWGLA